MVSGVEWEYVESNFRGDLEQLYDTVIDTDDQLLGDGISVLQQRNRKQQYRDRHSWVCNAWHAFGSFAFEWGHGDIDQPDPKLGSLCKR